MTAVSRRLQYRRAFLAAAALPLVSASPVPSGNAAGGTIALVITDTKFALVQTADGKMECPDGLQHGELEQWKAQDYRAMQVRFGGNMANRGPNGELSNQVPEMISEPLPWRDYGGKTAFGVNLDGTADGHATAKTCKHEKFTSIEGDDIRVDNQMQRVLGCVQGFRKSGFNTDFISKEMETLPESRILLEITGVNDEKNDPSVEVTMYKGLDRIVRDASGKWVSFMSHRIDKRFPHFTTRMHGRIENGVLITDPVALARMPVVQVNIPGERRLHEMVLRIKLDGDGAEGIMNGYEPLDTWWAMLRSHPGSDIGRYSPALVYKAAHRFADGFPDPKTKQCTAISTAYAVTATRALIARDTPENGRRIAARD
jgi:hypothetical protein